MGGSTDILCWETKPPLPSVGAGAGAFGLADELPPLIMPSVDDIVNCIVLGESIDQMELRDTEEDQCFDDMV